MGIEGQHQFQNASLAAQLCHTWLQHNWEGLFNMTCSTHRVKNRILLVIYYNFSFTENNCENRSNEIFSGTPTASGVITVAETFPISGTFRNGINHILQFF